MQTAEASRARAECGRASRELRGRFTLRHSDENIARIRGQRPEREHACTLATHAILRFAKRRHAGTIFFPSPSLRLSVSSGTNVKNHHARSAIHSQSSQTHLETRWQFSPFLSSRPFLDTASGELPAFCTLRSFCFLWSHPNNFLLDRSPRSLKVV